MRRAIRAAPPGGAYISVRSVAFQAIPESTSFRVRARFQSRVTSPATTTRRAAAVDPVLAPCFGSAIARLPLRPETRPDVTPITAATRRPEQPSARAFRNPNACAERLAVAALLADPPRTLRGAPRPPTHWSP